MANVIKIGIVKEFGKKIIDVSSVELISGKGIVGDRHFSKNNKSKNQITLIESENIDFYNKRYNTDIKYVDFRRNIITKGIELNELINKELFINTVKIKAYELCRPCKHLQEILNQKNLIKEMSLKSGLRCEILGNGNISIGDKIQL